METPVSKNTDQAPTSGLGEAEPSTNLRIFALEVATSLDTTFRTASDLVDESEVLLRFISDQAN